MANEDEVAAVQQSYGLVTLGWVSCAVMERRSALMSQPCTDSYASGSKHLSVLG